MEETVGGDRWDRGTGEGPGGTVGGQVRRTGGGTGGDRRGR